MSRYHSYIRTALDLLQAYRGETPFSLVLRDFFKEHRQYGSRDRKMVSALCYACFRAGHALNRSFDAPRMAAAYLLSDQPDPALLETLMPGWGERAGIPFTERLNSVADTLDTSRLFPWPALLSPAIPPLPFAASFLHQPGFFARIRPAQQANVLKKAASLQPPPGQPEPGCLRFAPGFDLTTVFEPDRDVVVQDLQSQHTLDILLTHHHQYTKPLRIWDCCAASGGKSILAYDLLEGKVELTVSDIRSNILRNLAARFERAGIRNYRSAVCDLEQAPAPLPGGSFDIIICDAPCTGSGTWGRTPEQLYSFDPGVLSRYHARQLSIAQHALPKLRTGGLLIYITCSVFTPENEEVVSHLVQAGGLECLQQQYLQGFAQGSDTLFTAVFRKTD